MQHKSTRENARILSFGSFYNPCRRNILRLPPSPPEIANNLFARSLVLPGMGKRQPSIGMALQVCVS